MFFFLALLTNYVVVMVTQRDMINVSMVNNGLRFANFVELR